MMEKVKLPKDVAKAIEDLRRASWTSPMIFQTVIDAKSIYHSSYDPTIQVLRKYFKFLREDAFMKALVNGYETERSPEEKLAELYKEHNEMVSFYNGKKLDRSESEQERYSSGIVKGIESTIFRMGLKIKGINEDA